jgi:stage II sporulation protein D
MLSMRVLFFLLAFLSLNVAHAQVFRIGINPKQNYSRVKFSNASSNYLIVGDSILIGILTANASCEVVKNSSGNLDVIFEGVRKAGLKNIKLIGLQNEGFVSFTGLSPITKERSFEGDFSIGLFSGKLKVINEIELEHYLRGVLESEAGIGQKEEYYKVQAVISRTFALKEINKHEHEGFNLCNQVHCQAYLGKGSGIKSIETAIQKTHKLVLLNTSGNFAPTYFSANCGGQTCDPIQVWNHSIDGIYSIRDTFCIRTKQAHWTSSIPYSDWKKFFVEKYNFPIDDSLSLRFLNDFPLVNRTGFYAHPGYGVPMRDLRERFNLKSSFFSAKLDNGKILLHGRGYGHGVGLCQEGAMTMVKLHYDFTQILGFYFPDFRLDYAFNAKFLE